jgi:hypothetical protein
MVLIAMYTSKDDSLCTYNIQDLCKLIGILQVSHVVVMLLKASLVGIKHVLNFDELY